MKQLILCLFFGLNIPLSMYAQPENLNNIQQRIDTAFYTSVRTNRLSELTAIERSLATGTTPLASYWMAYANYYEAAYYLQKKDKTTSEKIIKEGIQQLDGKNNKVSDDYALLAIMQTFSMQFMTNAIKMKFRSNTILKNIARAIKENGNNVRAYLAAGVTDYYTPAEYGGRKKTEAYLKKAISLPEGKINDTSQPTWGKELAYQLLIRFYLETKRENMAEQYMEEALRLYPNDFGLTELNREIEQSYGLFQEINK